MHCYSSSFSPFPFVNSWVVSSPTTSQSINWIESKSIYESIFYLLVLLSKNVSLNEKAHKPTNHQSGLCANRNDFDTTSPQSGAAPIPPKRESEPGIIGTIHGVTSNHSLSDRYSIRIICLPYNDHLFQYGGSNLFVNFPWTGGCERHFENGKGERCELPLWALSPISSFMTKDSKTGCTRQRSR